MRNDYYPEDREEPDIDNEQIKRKSPIEYGYPDNFKTFDRFLDSMYGGGKYGDYY